MLRFVVPIVVCVGLGCGAPETPQQLPGAVTPALASAAASGSPASPHTDLKAPSSAGKALGVYWNADAKEEGERLESCAALAIDEDGVLWMFARSERNIYGFVMRHDGGSDRASLEVAYPAQLRKGFAGSRWSIEGGALVETRPDGATRRARDEHVALTPLATPARWVGLEAARAELAMLGPLFVFRGMGKAGDECSMGILVPEPPWRESANRDARRVGVRVIGDSMTYRARAAGCAMSALRRDGLVEVEGNITDGYLVADDGGPAVFLAVGYMSAMAFVPSDRRGDPALRKLLDAAVGTAAE